MGGRALLVSMFRHVVDLNQKEATKAPLPIGVYTLLGPASRASLPSLLQRVGLETGRGTAYFVCGETEDGVLLYSRGAPPDALLIVPPPSGPPF